MIRQTTIGLGIVMTAALGLASAQTPQQTPSSADKQKTTAKMTLSGCLQDSPAGGEGYVLADARPAATGDRPTGTTGSSMAAASYKLNAPATVNLRAHVGHRIEVMGTTASADAGMRSPGSTDRSAQPGAQGRPGTTTDQPRTTTDQPRTTTEQPRTTTDQPRTTTDQPRTTTDQPRTTTNQPRTNTQSMQHSAQMTFNVESVKMISATCP